MNKDDLFKIICNDSGVSLTKINTTFKNLTRVGFLPKTKGAYQEELTKKQILTTIFCIYTAPATYDANQDFCARRIDNKDDKEVLQAISTALETKEKLLYVFISEKFVVLMKESKLNLLWGRMEHVETPADFVNILMKKSTIVPAAFILRIRKAIALIKEVAYN